MRRSTTDIKLGRFLCPLQVYRHKQTGERWVVRQIHRADAQVEISREHKGLRPICIPFSQLRDEYTWIAPAPERIA